MSELVSAGCTPKGAGSATLITKGLTAAYAFGVGNAGGGPISTYGGMGVALASLVPSIGAKIVTFYQTPMNRAITFGAAAALSAGVMLGLGGAEKKSPAILRILKNFSQTLNRRHTTKMGILKAEQKPIMDLSMIKIRVINIPLKLLVVTSLLNTAGKILLKV